ncbi:TetR/AcrR family transcriptional regulator [Actinoallomurus iriomotensis]|uniref:TetR family transcriptional regulator n=1 Tax=Actinoallomurus iriomotensis TaxID=478107 RepID=A0A9W6W0G6_9ACTN|nr:TetR/AcrR family transcriptional regulator [Actinoallomurus iriomotensis]GLY85747.1 TetR family transcriptional regulator [Actinoallomurus iriomotensis]
MPRDTDPISTSVWVRPSRPRRSEQPTLSREHIVRAAIELLDAEGLSGLSMRRLGAKLGAGATSVYWYVANKDELLELALDEAMGEVELPDPAATVWRSAVAESIRSVRTVILRHTWMAGLYGIHPAIGPQAMRLSDRLIAVLTAAGFSGLELAHASSLLMSHALGSAVMDVAMHTATTRSGKGANELVQQLEPYFDRIAGEYPSYAKWWSQNKDADLERLREDGFEFGLQRLLDGLESWLRPGD